MSAILLGHAGKLRRVAVIALLALPFGALELRAQQGEPDSVEASPRRSAVRDIITPQELRERRKAAPKLGELLKERAKPAPSQKPKPSAKDSLLARSIILFDGEKYTLIPKGSILHLPEAHRARIVAEPQGGFTVWRKFLKRNASWLAPKEVPLEMAQGDATSAQAILREIANDERVLVSVYKGGPIMVLEPEPVPAEPENRTASP
ncbi:MAG: hypothetical protein O3C21_15660 [Verrucomicrobia bacterium]|nr:hypothetical protein [Verrucomicrobiota bacterium]